MTARPTGGETPERRVVRTPRGFEMYARVDHDNQLFQVQQSSAVDDTERGVNQPGSSYLLIGVSHGYRSRIDRDTVQEIIVILQNWLDTGYLSGSPASGKEGEE